MSGARDRRRTGPDTRIQTEVNLDRNIGQMWTRQQPGKYLSPPVARGVMAEPEIVS